MNKNQNKFPALLLAAILCFSVFSGCTQSQTGDAPEEGSSLSPSSESQPAVVAPTYDSADLDGSWDDEHAVHISLNGDSVQVEGSGASADGSVVTITQGGTYVLSGTLDNGQVRVEASKGDTVQLVLNGADISCEDSAPLYSQSADKTVVTLAPGTSNALRDGEVYQYPHEETDEPDAALFAKDDLTINGSGSLTVTASYNNGIGCKDDLVIAGGTLNVTSVNHGIRGRDSVTVLDGSITIRSGNDGIQSNNDSGESKGWISLEGGVYSITSANDGVQAETDLVVSGGEFTILSGGGSEATQLDADGSYKGLKAGNDLLITGGSFLIDSADDAIHSNNDVTIEDGVFQLSTGDDGVHADNALTINGGTIDILVSYEGLEGATVTITDGEIRLTATDDGINAAGGNDSSGGGGRFGMDRFAANDDYYIDISGGWIVVNASGDGIDSNGNVFMSGGVLIVNGPTRGADAPLDFDGSFQLTGGVIVAAGSSGMAQAPGSDSAQSSLQVYYSTIQTAGTSLHLADADGNPVLTFTPEKDYENVVITTPELEEGKTYRLYSGGSDSGQGVDGLVREPDYTPGELVVEVTLSGATTRISDTGEAVTGGFGMGGRGGGGFGGGQPGGDAPGRPSGGDWEPPDGIPGEGGGPGGEGGPGREGPGEFPGDGPGGLPAGENSPT